MIYLEEQARLSALDVESSAEAGSVLNTRVPDVEAALGLLRAQAPRCLLSTAYYEGRHKLFFATEKFRNAFGGLFRNFSDNLLSVVVEIITDRMIINGFEVEEGNTVAGDRAWEIWKRNRMDLFALEAMREAFITGDGYVIVWPDDKGNARIYPQAAENCAVFHDPEAPERIIWGVKIWISWDRKLRLNLYYADRIEKYITLSSFDQTGGAVPERLSSFVPYTDDGLEAWPLPNPWGEVPIFHFANNARVGSDGRSEILPLTPLQDALNKSIIDLLVNMEYQAFPQRYATGIEVRRDPSTGQQVSPFKPGVDRLWVATSADAKFGDLQQGNLAPFLDVAESFRREIARISGIPLHYFLQSGSFPSGQALRIAETRLIKKVQNRQTAFGNIWENAMALALKMDGLPGDTRLSAQWEGAAPEDVTETLQNLILKQQLGAPAEKLLEEAGYGAAEVEEMMAAKSRQTATLDEVLERSFDRGELPS
jgi:hypothetical protein